MSGNETLIDVVGGHAHDVMRAVAVMPCASSRGWPAHAQGEILNWRMPQEPSASVSKRKSLFDSVFNEPPAHAEGQSDGKVWTLAEAVRNTPMDFDDGRLGLNSNGVECPEEVRFILDIAGKPAERHNVRMRLSPMASDNRVSPPPMPCHAVIAIAGSEIKRVVTQESRPSGQKEPFVYLSAQSIERVRWHVYNSPALRSVVLVIPGVEWLFAGRRRISLGEAGRPFSPLALALEPEIMRDLLTRCFVGASETHDLLRTLDEWQRMDSDSRMVSIQPASANGFTFDDGEPNVDRTLGRPLLTPSGILMSVERKSNPDSNPFPTSSDIARRWVPLHAAEAMLGILTRKVRPSAYPVDSFLRAVGSLAAAA